MKRIGINKLEFKKLSLRSLSADELAAADGACGVCRGYFECLECGYIQDSPWDACPRCSVGWSETPNRGSCGGGCGGGGSRF